MKNIWFYFLQIPNYWKNCLRSRDYDRKSNFIPADRRGGSEPGLRQQI